MLVSSNDEITQNNLIDNKRNAYFEQPLIDRIEFRKILGKPLGWFNLDENYWNRPRFLPKPIFGSRGFIGIIPWVQFDWHPAKEPYDI